MDEAPTNPPPAPEVEPLAPKKPLYELPVDGDGTAFKKQLEDKNAIASSINPTLK
jgi:hypothetical protein